MGSIMQCLFRICCDADEERGPDDYYPPNAAVLARLPAQAARMPRVHSLLDDRGEYHATSVHGNAEGDNEEDGRDDDINSNINQEEEPDSDDNGVTDCCHPNSANGKQAAENNPHARGIQEFFRQIQSRWRRYDSLVHVPTDDEDNDDDTVASSSRAFRSKSGMFPYPSSPLRAAASFDSTREIPTINSEEFVMPRSLLQEQMAKAMAAKMQNEDDECVICMEGFDPTNPRMPTNCGCGRDRTYFHLPCLYQWVEQSPDCPSCRERLTWKEF
jgi:hypothetical protein